MEKGIVIVNENLPVGLKANICAVLGMSLGKKYPEIVGGDIFTLDRESIPGITQIPLPILQSSSEKLSEIFDSHRNSDVFMTIFDNSALTTKNYSEFQNKISCVNLAELQIHGLIAYGPKKTINKISADIPLLK